MRSLTMRVVGWLGCGPLDSRRRGLGRRGLGRRGERLAARWLRRQGLEIVARNVRCGRGEIDLVGLDGEVLVFVEVKSRTGRSWRQGLDKIDEAKREALRRACRRYARGLGHPDVDWRIDLVSVEFEAGWWRPRLREVRWDRHAVAP